YPEIASCSNFVFQAEDGIRARNVTGVQTCALPIFRHSQKFFDLTELGQARGQGVHDLAEFLQGTAVGAYGRAYRGVAQHRLGGEPVTQGGPPPHGGRWRVAAEDLLDALFVLCRDISRPGKWAS